MTQVRRYTKTKLASTLLVLFAAAANAASTRSDTAQDDSAWPVESAATLSFGVPGFDDAPQVSATAEFVDPEAAVDGSKPTAAAAPTALSFVDPQAAAEHDATAHDHAVAGNDRALQSPSSLTTTE